MFGAPDCALDDETVTMRPQPAASMSATAACTQVNVPVRLTAMMRSHVSGVMSSSAVNDSMPALVTRSSTGPSPARTLSKAAATDARSATSTSTASASAPVACTCAAAASAAAPFWSRIATRWPSAANCNATPSPMPDAPPVTTATRLTGSLIASPPQA